MRAASRVVIQAAPDLVFRLGADVARWPVLLAHYRSVKVLDEKTEPGGGTVRQVCMAASRSGIPLRWTAVQETDPASRRIFFRWTGGALKGMAVVWRVEERDEGVEVIIDHVLEPRPWWLRNRLTEYVVARQFIENVAGKTLRGIKRHAEGKATSAERGRC